VADRNIDDRKMQANGAFFCHHAHPPDPPHRRFLSRGRYATTTALQNGNSFLPVMRFRNARSRRRSAAEWRNVVVGRRFATSCEEIQTLRHRICFRF
jgi:hypothetical protein